MRALWAEQPIAARGNFRAANIVEDCGRRQTAEYVQFLAIARGSLAELETYVEIAVRLDI